MANGNKWEDGFKVVTTDSQNGHRSPNVDVNNQKGTNTHNGIKCQSWSSLHTHSDASHDGIRPLSELVRVAAEKNFKHIAFTEHGTLSSSISASQECHDRGIKPIHGNEIYLDYKGGIYHLTLLADGNKGFETLIELNNIGKQGELTRSAVSYASLKKHTDGIVVLSGCPASPMQLLEWNEALKVAMELKGIFGNRFFTEMMFTSTGSSPSWERSLRLSRATDTPLVLTNDVHFPTSADAKAHAVYQDMKTQGRFTYESSSLFLATDEELRRRVSKLDPALLSYLEIGMYNSFQIGETISEVVFDSEPKLPVIVDAEEKLEASVWQAFSNYANNGDAAADRVRYELDIIITKGYATYFLIVKDLIDNARSSDVVIGPGRGSAVGSLVAYLLNITEVDPIQYGLQFERFLNPNRSAMPDIDTDIAASQRHILLDYANRQYGAIPIITQSHNTEKSLIRDLCRFYKTSRKEEDKAADGGYDSDDFNAVARKNKDMREVYLALLGQIRHRGKHAGGIVMVDSGTKIPFEKTTDDELAAAWTEGQKAELSKAGIIKFDFLGLSALDILRELQETTNALPPVEPTKGAPEFELVRQGKTLGVFQLTGSDGIRNYAVEVQPDCIEDIIALTSLWRTGPIQANAHSHYLKARHGKPRKIHPEVDEILKETFGLIVYQEDFMRLYAWATGRDLGDADNARRVIVKHKPEDPNSVVELLNLESEFKNGCSNRGLKQKASDKLWSEIVTHTGYSFNKSHATAYSIISWKMLWYKHNYPAQYYAALLNHDPERQQEYIFDVVAEGFSIVQPDINHSSSKYTTDGQNIYVPFTAINHLGPNGAQEIIMKRPFTTPESFMASVEKRKVPKRSRVGLYQLGAFRSIGGTPEQFDIELIDMLCVANTTRLTKFLKPWKIDNGLLVKLLIDDITDDEFTELYKQIRAKGKTKFIELLRELSVQIGENIHYLADKHSHLIGDGKLKSVLFQLQGIATATEDMIRATYLGVAIPSQKRVGEINNLLLQDGKSAGIVLDIDRRSSRYNPVYWRVQLYPGRSVWTTSIAGIHEGSWIACDMSEQTGKLLKWRAL